MQIHIHEWRNFGLRILRQCGQPVLQLMQLGARAVQRVFQPRQQDIAAMAILGQRGEGIAVNG